MSSSESSISWTISPDLWSIISELWSTSYTIWIFSTEHLILKKLAHQKYSPKVTMDLIAILMAAAYQNNIHGTNHGSTQPTSPALNDIECPNYQNLEYLSCSLSWIIWAFNFGTLIIFRKFITMVFDCNCHAINYQRTSHISTRPNQ